MHCASHTTGGTPMARLLGFLTWRKIRRHTPSCDGSWQTGASASGHHGHGSPDHALCLSHHGRDASGTVT